jgi:hypothetical protein
MVAPPLHQPKLLPGMDLLPRLNLGALSFSANPAKFVKLFQGGELSTSPVSAVSAGRHGAVQLQLSSNHSHLTSTEAFEVIGCGNYNNALRTTR